MTASGGVRGIVELYVLQAIERALGDGLRIQDFIDLIVGTRYVQPSNPNSSTWCSKPFHYSTGGIVALGLGVNNWSVDDCITTFKEICSKAFTPRGLVGIPVLEQLAIVNHGSMYKTKPFEALLQEKFQRGRPLFGGTNDQGEMSTRVAVTSTTLIEQHPVILTNYNRPDEAEHGTWCLHSNQSNFEWLTCQNCPIVLFDLVAQRENSESGKR